MEYQRLSSGAPYSRKLMSNGPGGLSGKHVYDGVFGGAAVKPAGTSRVEDYREIFGASGANTCSIPILEVPELDEDSANSKAYGAGGGAQRVDYTKIFGGLGDADFGVAHEELVTKPKRLNDSFKQTRTPTQGRSQLAGSERFNIPKEQKVPSSEASFQSFDGVKQFNVSYNKSNPGSKNGTNGTTHIAQFHAVPGYTFLVDEMPPSKMTEGGKTVRSVLNDAHLNFNVSEDLKEGKGHRKAVSGPQPSVAATNSIRSPAGLQKKSSRTRSISNDMSFDAFEIGLGRNPPSTSPANFSNNNGGSNTSMNSKFRVSRSDTSGGVSANYSPAFSDEEVDANSDAAASAAALRKAIEEAQMKIKVAKGLMERKKGLQNHTKMSFENGVKSQKRGLKTAGRVNVSKEQEIQEKCETKDTPKQDFTSLSEVQNGTKATALTPDLKDEKQSPITNIAVEETHCLESKSRSTLKQAFTSLSEKNATKATVLTPNLKDEKQSPIANNAFEETQCLESKSSPKRAFTRLSEQNATKATILTPDLKDEKQSLITNNVVDEKLCFESISTQIHNRLEEAEDWESTEEFFEALESEEHSEVALKLDQVDSAKQMVPSDHENERVEKMTAEEKIKKPEEFIEERKAFEEPFFIGEKIEREVNSAVGLFQWNVYANFIKSARELYQEGNDDRIGGACKQEEADEIPEVSYEWEECETKLEKFDQPEENAELPIHVWVETEKIHRKALAENEKKNRSDEVPLAEENDGGRSEIHEKEENVEGNGEGFDRIECERKLQEGWNLEEYDENHNFHRTEDAEMSCEVHKEEIIKVRINDLQLQDKDEADERLGEDGGVEGHRKVEEPKENEQILEQSDQINGAEKSRGQIHEGIETEMVGSEIHLWVEDEKNMEATECASRYDGKNLQPANDAIKQEENENQDGNDKAWGHKINFGAVHLTAEVLAVRENERIMEATEVSPLPEETEKGSKAADEANNLEEEETFETAGLSQGFIIVDANKKQTVDITEVPVIGKNGTYPSEIDVNKQSEHQKTDYNSLSNQESCSEATRDLVENGNDNMQGEHQETDYNSMSNQENCNEEVTSQLVENGDDMYRSEVGTHHEEIESSSVSSPDESLPDDNTESLSDPEFGGNCMDIEQSEVPSNLGEHENSFESSHKERCVDNIVDVETSQETCMFEGQGKTMEISEEEELSQSTDEKENQRENLASEEKKAEHTLQKDVEVEKEHLRKKEEEKEWEMEKEKERIAVERAIREARERAFAEARERAEKAAVERVAAEAKQRLMTETRERLEKASTRVSDKLAAEKASMEAKLKAERAAVERATAEARQRALEKALSEKAAFKARNEVEKSAAGKSSNISKDNGTSSNGRYNVSGPSSGSKYPGSSKHEKFNGANVESAQRSKATLERHQRTAERTAKALAEKNMRDLLAEKEQAERNRLAETLDIDVKRWSSGKERNLRALLSTLQYILGPDSGWQAIPLTDLISSTAVKKAYRKATLFVHPDKLQQRGASMQQKYTCEKVFDLLQEAWNKFSAEER